MKVTNEELFEQAITGDEKALVQLFNQVKLMWKSPLKTPFDSHNLNDYDDWQSIATSMFFKSWHKFNPSKGGQFSTYIFTCVKHAWRNELRRQKTRELYIAYPDDDNPVENLAVTSYMDVHDLEWVHEFLERFKKSLEQEPSRATQKNLFDVCQACFELGEASSLEVSKMIGMHRKFASRHIKELKTRMEEFMILESDLKYDFTIQS